MSNGRRRINLRQYLRRGTMSRTYKRRRFIRPSRRLPTYNRSTRYVARPLGNPLAITERKYHDVERNTGLVSTPTPDWGPCSADPIIASLTPSPYVYSFNAIPVGTSWQQRIGRKVQIVSLKIKGEIGLQAATFTPATPFIAQTIRIIIYVDMQTNGEYPSTPDGLLYSGPTTNLHIAYFQDANNFGRYKILKDHRFVINPMSTMYLYSTGGGTIDSYVKLIDYTHNFYPPLTVHYNSANTGTNADIIDNSIHMAVGVDNGAAPQCFFSYKARLTFFDA